MNKYVSLAAGAACLLGATLPGSVWAQGAFDFVDSTCVNATNDFAAQQQAYIAKVRSAQASVETMQVPAEFRAAWLKAAKANARPIFDEQAPMLREMGMSDMNKGFDKWFDWQLSRLKPGEVDQAIEKSFRTLAREQLKKDKVEGDASFAKAKSDLDSGCKADVGSQVLRVALAPIGWIDGNVKAAKNERNGFTAVIRGVTGVSLKDIAHQGPLGGDSSELRKFVNGMVGGEDGAIRATLSSVDPTHLVDGGSHEDVVHQVGRAIDPTQLFHGSSEDFVHKPLGNLF